MKRIVSFILCLGVLLAIPTACQAVEQKWTFDSNKTILAKLYKYRGDINSANASTTNLSGRGCEVLLWATDRVGDRLGSTKADKESGKTSCWVKNTYKGVVTWVSGHSTYPTNDPVNRLYLKVR